MRALTTVLIACTAVLLSGTAAAQSLDEALGLEAEGRLGDALDAFEATLRTSGNSRDDLSTIYLHLSMLRFGTGEQEAARRALNRLRAVAPEATLPDSAPPELQQLFEQVANIWGERRLRGVLSGPESLEHGATLEVRLHVVDDVAGLVASAALLDDEALVAESEGTGPFTFSVEAERLEAGRHPLEARLLDEHGGILWQGSDFVVEVAAAASGAGVDVVEPTNTPHRGMRIAGWVLLGGAVAAGGAGAALLILDGRPTGEVRQLPSGRNEDEVYRTDVAGWVTVGLAAAALTISLVLLLIRRRQPPRERSIARLLMAGEGPGRW